MEWAATTTNTNVSMKSTSRITNSLHRHLTICCYSSGLKGGRNCIKGVQFSRVLKSANLTHIVIGSHENFRQLDELLEQVPTLADPQKAYQQILTAFTHQDSLPSLKRVHAHILRHRANSSAFVSNLLVQAYARCGSLHLATQVFSSTINRNQHSWSILISACVRGGSHRQALELYKKMRFEFQPNEFILSTALRACAQLGELEQGREIHRELIDSRRPLDLVLQNALLTMYAKCGDLRKSRELFDGMPERNLVTWNAIISAYVQNGEPREALKLYQQMPPERWNTFILASALTACSMLPQLELGMEIHGKLSEKEVRGDPIIQNALMNMYAKCGELREAEKIFDDMPKPDICAWTTLISGYAQLGHSEPALKLYRRMRDEKLQPNGVTFAVVIPACESLEELQSVEKHAGECGCGADPLVMTSLLGMYSKLGLLEKARGLFASIGEKDVVCWSSMIAAYSQNGFPAEALKMFQRMLNEGVEPNPVTLTSVFSACAAGEALEQGRAIHQQLSGEFLSDNVNNTLARMYCRCGSLEDAREVFQKIRERETLTWGTMIAALVQRELPVEALKLYHMMDAEPDEFVLAGAAAACSALGKLEEGREIHLRAHPRELTHDVLASSLLHMYVKCNRVEEARELFLRLENNRNVYSWTVMIGAHASSGNSDEALRLFRSMELEGIQANEVTLGSVLPALSSPGDLSFGRELHGRLQKPGEELPDRLVTGLIAMYSRCGSLREARELFEESPERAVYSWNALISGYNQQGLHRESLELFAMALNACSAIGELEEGRRIHILTRTREIGVEFVFNALVTMYSRCGRMEEAREVFEGIPEKNVVSWTGLISGYVNNGLPREALELYHRMDLEPDEVTFVCALNSCAALGDLQQGKLIHFRVSSTGHLQRSEYVSTALANMYAKCGAMVQAREVFDKMTRRDTISWNSMITAYAQHGSPEQVVELQREMLLTGVAPNGVTFIGVLVSCRQAEAALYHFQEMISEHGVPVMPEHHQCVTDVFARTGHLAEAEKLLQKNESPVAWLAFLSACRDQGDASRGKRAAEHVFELDPVDTAPYTLLSNI